jgi:hypothetical protein
MNDLFVPGMVFGAFLAAIGAIFVIVLVDAHYTKIAIEYGIAQYNTTTGVFEWKNAP